MHWLLSAVQGAAWGAVCGLVKYWLLWRPLFRPLTADTAGLVIGLNVALSHLFNLISLVTLFVLRQHLADPWEAGLIAAAVALSLSGRIPIFLRAARKRREQKPPQAPPNAAEATVTLEQDPDGGSR